MDVGEDGDAHGRMTVPKALGSVALAAVWVLAASLLWRTEVPGSLQLPHLDPGDFFGSAELERIHDFRRVSRQLFLGSLAVQILVLAGLVAFARPLARRIGQVVRGQIRTGVALGLVAAAAVWAAQLPLGAVSHRRNTRYGLTEQGWGGWLADSATGLAVEAVLVGLAVAIAMLLARRLGSRWWVAAGPAFALVAVLFAVLQPLAVQPLTNTFRPLRDRALAGQIQALAEKEGVSAGPVQETNASRQTTEANAYVAGIGPSRRVVLYDTILDGRFSRGEILVVSAHELAHVGRRHIWKGLGWFALIAIPGTAAVGWATNRRGGLRDPAVVPLGLFAALILYLGTLPLQNAVSRRYEAEADWIGLRATNDPRDLIGLQRTFARTSLAQPDPPDWVTVWFGTHPTTMERIAMAEAYAERRGLSGRSRGGS